ncbi:hypothetical protein Tco_0955168 [Tanacetum coccineum]|uniref:Retrovirus-related Pol polyprotein from transposon TNT 1-94-like beta-barrel domain-containing protein n=1 Tax=Tanacetum coccineum TaxID=301880 RepID=A0ABQ5E6F4_9ASTR
MEDKLHFVEEPVEIMDREVKQLRQSRVPIVKVRWNSRRGPEFTWEHKINSRRNITPFHQDRTVVSRKCLCFADKMAFSAFLEFPIMRPLRMVFDEAVGFTIVNFLSPQRHGHLNNDTAMYAIFIYCNSLCRASLTCELRKANTFCDAAFVCIITGKISTRTRALMTVMLANKLQVDESSKMANELLRKIFYQVNYKFKGGLLGIKVFYKVYTARAQLNSNVKRFLFTTPVAAKSKNLGTTSVVAKSRLSVANILKATNKVIQLVLWIVDSGCSKHMTGNLQLLRNFFEKFIETVRFRNDHFAAITGYGDYVQGNLTICHVYYVEGLRHNL